MTNMTSGFLHFQALIPGQHTVCGNSVVHWLYMRTGLSSCDITHGDTYFLLTYLLMTELSQFTCLFIFFTIWMSPCWNQSISRFKFRSKTCFQTKALRKLFCLLGGGLYKTCLFWKCVLIKGWTAWSPEFCFIMASFYLPWNIFQFTLWF